MVNRMVVGALNDIVRKKPHTREKLKYSLYMDEGEFCNLLAGKVDISDDMLSVIAEETGTKLSFWDSLNMVGGGGRRK